MSFVTPGTRTRILAKKKKVGAQLDQSVPDHTAFTPCDNFLATNELLWCRNAAKMQFQKVNAAYRRLTGEDEGEEDEFDGEEAYQRAEEFFSFL